MKIDYFKWGKICLMMAVFFYLFVGVYAFHGSLIVAVIQDIPLIEALEQAVGDNVFIATATVFGRYL